jgi:hypothetical protein
MKMASGVSRAEEVAMGIWLKEMRIAFEFTRIDFDKTIEIKLIDYKNQCLLASKKFSIIPDRINNDSLRELVKQFERDEVYPLLFEENKFRTDDPESLPKIRLIRED